MLSKSFKPAKCKTSLKLAVARIKLLRNKREVQVKQMRRELAQLLDSGQEQTARIRVEHVIREEKTMSAYELIELYCELIVARLPIIESQKSCPIDLKEAVSSVIFASPRCADLPELMDIRKHFAAKYGKEFINSALEVRPDCGVSRLVVEKLSARAPDVETKVKTLTTIAQEHNVKWDSEKIEEELKKPHDDLLSGPTAFASASMPMESSNVNPSPAPSQTNELSWKMPQNDTANRTRSSTTFSETITRTGTSVPFSSQSESRPSESRSQGGEVKNSYYKGENASLNRPTWSMEFQDATSAAQAAAESAERASMAARAAAELASRGNMSRQNSSGSNESPSYNKKYERPEKLRVILGEDIAEESAPKVSDELKSSQGLKIEAENLQQDERMQGISRREAARTSNNDYSTGSRPLGQSSPRTSQGFVNDDILDVNFHKDVVEEHSRAERISSESERVELNHPNMKYENVESSREKINVYPSKAASPHYGTDNEKFWNSDIYKHENDGETSRMDAGADSLGINHEKSTFNDSSAVVFDNYGCDAEDNNSVFGRNRGNLLDSYQGELPCFQSNKGPFSVDQNRSGSFAKHSGSQLHLFTKSHPEEHSETMTKVSFPSQSNESVPPAFDVSDGESTESEIEVVKSPHKEAMRPSNSLHDQGHSMSSFSDESTRESKQTYIGEITGVKETIRNSGTYDKNTETDLCAADKFSRRSGSNILPNSHPSPRSDKTPRNSNVPVGGPGYSSSDEEEPEPLHLTRRQPTRDTDDKEKSRMPSMHLDTEGSEVSNEFSDESAQGINFGRLTGGFKHRGFPRPPYVRSTAADASQLSKQTSDATSNSEKPIVSDLGKQSVSFKVADQERYNQESHPKAYASKSRTSGASVDSHSNTAKGLASRYSAEDTSDMDERRILSQKTRIAKDVDVSAPESYYGRGYKEVNSNFQGAYYDPDSDEQTHYTVDTRRYRDHASVPQKQSSDASPEIDELHVSIPDKTYASSEVPKQYDQKPHMKPKKGSSSRTTYLDSDDSEAKLGSDYTAGSRVKLSRRTRDVPPESKNSSPGVTESLPNTTYDAVTIQGKGSSKPVRSNPSAVQPSVATKQMPSTREESPKSQLDPTENIVPTNNGSTKFSSSSGESVSRESSLKKASHTHPKLPDYESLAAHFHSLRSNRR